MKITIKKFKEFLNHCPDNDWMVEFRKWEHMDGTPRFNGYRGWPNIVGLMIVDNFQRVDDITGMLVNVFVMKEELHNDINMHPEEINKIFCQDFCDEDFIEFRLEIEELPGKFTQLDMTPDTYDMGYLEKFMIIHFEEDKK